MLNLFYFWLVGVMIIYVSFIFYIKKNYDYGVLIFFLIFNLMIVLSYCIDNVWNIVKDCMFIIVMGCGLCFVMSMLVFLNWLGEDFYNNIMLKFEGLVNFM